MKSLPPEVFAELQKEYLEAFREYFIEIKKALNHSDWPTLESFFHRFAGSGQTYSYPEISEIAKAIELYIKFRLYKKGLQPDSKVLTDSVQFFETMIEDFRRGRPVPPTAKATILNMLGNPKE